LYNRITADWPNPDCSGKLFDCYNVATKTWNEKQETKAK